MKIPHRTLWTADRIAMLRDHYTQETNETLALRLGICSKTLVRKARLLGLTKQPVRVNHDTARIVQSLYDDHSYSEIAAAAQVSVRTVSRIVRSLHLQRTPAMERQIRSRRRRELIRSERAHVVFGLPQRTRIKVVCNKKRIALRSRLKANGYIVYPGMNTIYYPSEIQRRPLREEHGIRMGLRFEPVRAMAGLQRYADMDR